MRRVHSLKAKLYLVIVPSSVKPQILVEGVQIFIKRILSPVYEYIWKRVPASLLQYIVEAGTLPTSPNLLYEGTLSAYDYSIQGEQVNSIWNENIFSIHPYYKWGYPCLNIGCTYEGRLNRHTLQTKWVYPHWIYV